jgi:hypothetical protein
MIWVSLSLVLFVGFLAYCGWLQAQYNLERAIAAEDRAAKLAKRLEFLANRERFKARPSPPPMPPTKTLRY